MPYTADRESRLDAMLARVAEAGKKGLGKKRMIGWASDEFKVSPKTASDYIETLMVREVITNEFGTLRSTEKGRKRAKEQTTIPTRGT